MEHVKHIQVDVFYMFCLPTPARHEKTHPLARFCVWLVLHHPTPPTRTSTCPFGHIGSLVGFLSQPIQPSMKTCPMWDTFLCLEEGVGFSWFSSTHPPPPFQPSHPLEHKNVAMVAHFCIQTGPQPIPLPSSHSCSLPF